MCMTQTRMQQWFTRASHINQASIHALQCSPRPSASKPLIYCSCGLAFRFCMHRPFHCFCFLSPRAFRRQVAVTVTKFEWVTCMPTAARNYATLLESAPVVRALLTHSSCALLITELSIFFCAIRISLSTAYLARPNNGVAITVL